MNAAPRWRVRLLGAVALTDAQGREQPLVQRAPALLLARLALQPARRHPREALAELLWPGTAAAVSRNRLRQALAALRERLADGDAATTPLQADRQSVWLERGRIDTDLEALLAGLDRGEAAALAFARRPDAAEALLPGHLDDWVLAERAWLAERLLSTAFWRIRSAAVAAAVAMLFFR